MPCLHTLDRSQVCPMKLLAALGSVDNFLCWYWLSKLSNSAEKQTNWQSRLFIPLKVPKKIIGGVQSPGSLAFEMYAVEHDDVSIRPVHLADWVMHACLSPGRCGGWCLMEFMGAGWAGACLASCYLPAGLVESLSANGRVVHGGCVEQLFC